MSRFDDDRDRLAAARRRDDERAQYVAAERREEIARHVRGASELRERFQKAAKRIAHHNGFVSLDLIRAEMSTTVIGLTLKHTQRLAVEAGLTVDWDGVITRNAVFEAFVR